MRFGQGQRILGRHIAGHHHDGVVGRVIRRVEGQGIVTVECCDLMHPADDRAAVGVVQELRGRHLFVQEGAGIAVGALAAFFDDDLAFGGHILFGEDQIAHAFCLHLHHQAQTVGGNPLEIGGVIPAGKGVVIAALRLDCVGKLTRGQIVGALEHQVFEEMRDAGMAGRLICGTGAIPDHMGDDGGAVIFDHHKLKAIVEREAGDVIGCQCRSGKTRTNCQGRKDQTHRDKLRQKGVAWEKIGGGCGTTNPACTNVMRLRGVLAFARVTRRG